MSVKFYEKIRDVNKANEEDSVKCQVIFRLID